MIVDPIDEDTVFERLRSTLAERGLALHRGTLDGAASDERGRFYTTADTGDQVIDRDVDLERWARRHGALAVNEALVPSRGEVDG